MASQAGKTSVYPRKLIDASIHPLLRPLIRAYILGYASSTVPRLLTLLITYLSKGRKDEERTESGFTSSFQIILRGGLDPRRFPTFCSVLVGGSTFLQIPIRLLVSRLVKGLSAIARERITKWLSAFIAAWLSIKLLQSKESEAFIDRVPPNTYSPSGVAIKSRKFAGRTMDLTLFALTRAVDVVVGELWSRRRTRRLAANKWTRLETAISKLTDPAIFATSCGLIMWAWIYLPERLPRAYVKWISGAAAVDRRLVTALQRVQWGEIVYGQKEDGEPLLQSMCEDYGWPLVWSDPSKTIPFPCELVHMGTGPSCEYHAFRRFLKGFGMAAGTYGPLNLALQLRNPSKKGFLRAIISSLRSSAFLGSFIALFYYGVCLARSRLGPIVLGTSIPARMRIDSGICIGSGCMLCGWSILLENAGRRKDISLFVAPRALATLLPRRYELMYQWRETAAFAASSAVVFACAQENPERVRGVLGKLLARVLKQ